MIKTFLKENWAFSLIFLTLPFVLLGLCEILPLEDDWNYLTAPYFGDIKAVLTPVGDYWRPLDALIGWVLHYNTALFPTLNHTLALLGHLLSAFVIYDLCLNIGVRKAVANMAVLFFYLSPTAVGPLTNADGLNQIYSSFWGLLAIWFLCVKVDNKVRRNLLFVSYVLCCLLATFSKENGITWFVIAPLFAFFFGFIDRRALLRVACVGTLGIVFYFALRWSLPNVYIYGSVRYYDYSLRHVFTNVGKFFSLTFVQVDYLSLYIRTSSQLGLAILTALFTLPFTVFIFARLFSVKRFYENKKAFLLLGFVLMSASVHVVTSFSVMHAYSSLAMMTLLVAYILRDVYNKRIVKCLFVLMLLGFVIIDVHYSWASYRSSLKGQELGRRAAALIKDEYVKKLFVIAIADMSYEYSTYLVSPSRAFNFGDAIPYYFSYRYPQKTTHVLIDKNQRVRIPELLKEAEKQGYERVLLLNGADVELLK